MVNTVVDGPCEIAGHRKVMQTSRRMKTGKGDQAFWNMSDKVLAGNEYCGKGYSDKIWNEKKY